jgi:hypothetical protein
MPFLLVDAQVIQTLRSTPPSLFNSFILLLFEPSLSQPHTLVAESHCSGFSGAEHHPNAAVHRESAIGAMPFAFLSRKFSVQSRKGNRVKSKMK